MVGLRMKPKGLTVVLVTAGAVVVGAIYWYAVGKERYELKRRGNQVKDVALACQIYAEKHGGHFPCDLRDLSEIYRQFPSFFARALAELELAEPCSHITNDTNAVLIQERTADVKGRVVFGYFDGHCNIDMAKVVTQEEAIQIAQRHATKHIGFTIVDQPMEVKFDSDFHLGPAWRVDFGARDIKGFGYGITVWIKPDGAIINSITVR